MTQDAPQSSSLVSPYNDSADDYIRQLKMQNTCFQEALSHASHYISAVRGKLSLDACESQELEDLYTSWSTVLQRCQLQSQDHLLQNDQPPGKTVPLISAPDRVDGSGSLQMPKILRDCLIIQTDGVSEALEGQVVHTYAAELRLLRGKVVVLQEEFGKEHDLRIASEKLNTCLQNEIRSQAESLKECSDENAELHNKIRTLKAQIYEMDTSAEAAYDDNLKLAERVRHLTGSMSEIRVRVGTILRLFGRKPSSHKPARPVSAAAATGVRRMVSCDINSEGILEDCKQLQLLVTPLLDAAATHDSGTAGCSGGLPPNCDESAPNTEHPLSLAPLENQPADTSSCSELPPLMHNSVIQQSLATTAGDSPPPLSKDLTPAETTPLSMQTIVQRLQEFEKTKEQLTLLTVEAQSTQTLLQHAVHDREVAEKKSSEYQDRLSRAEAEVKRMGKTLHNLMESIINFDSCSDPPIFDTAALAQESLDLAEPIAKPIIECLSVHDKNSATTIKLLQRQIDTLKLETEKLRMSNLMLLKREACNTNVIRNMEQQLHRLSDENFFLAGENSVLLGTKGTIDPNVGLATLTNDNKTLREQFVSMQQKYSQLKSEHDKLVSSYKALKIELSEEQGRRARAEDRCTIMRDEIQELNDGRRSRSASRAGSRRSSVSGPPSVNGFRDDPQGTNDVIRSLKRTIATVRLENVSLSSQIETLIFSEARTKQCVTQLMLENHKLVTEAVCRDVLISALQNEARRHLQTLLRMCVLVPSGNAHEELNGRIVKLEEQLLARDTALETLHEERAKLAAKEAALCIDVDGLSMENVRLTIENDNLTNQLEVLKRPEQYSSGAQTASCITHRTTIEAADKLCSNTPSSSEGATNSRLLFTLARADIVLNQKHHSSDSCVEAELSKVSDSMDKLALQNKHLQHENIQIRHRLKEAEKQHLVPHDSLLRMARYLNEKEEELFSIVEMAQVHNSQLVGLHNYVSRLMNECLSPVENDMCRSIEASDVTSLQIKQILRQLVKEVTSLKPLAISSRTASLRVSTASELLQRFTSV
ncbi:Coiled-coil protein [Giardia lamblia P15]|uniref:Coiled-coil protein n=1 Tax=Giardia intestinalis (strain P15) TaxID=658858 RepID=E1F102_GIAIA|nr:Coiled-coil protein [Giardia lamblia P15]